MARYSASSWFHALCILAAVVCGSWADDGEADTLDTKSVAVAVAVMGKQVGSLPKLASCVSSRFVKGTDIRWFISTDDTKAVSDTCAMLTPSLCNIVAVSGSSDRLNRLSRFQHILDVEHHLLDFKPDLIVAARLPFSQGLDAWCELDEAPMMQLLGGKASNPSLFATCFPPAGLETSKAIVGASALGHGGMVCEASGGIVGGWTRSFLEMVHTIIIDLESDSLVPKMAPRSDDSLVHAYASHFSQRFALLRLEALDAEQPGKSPDDEGARPLLTVTGYPGRLGNWMFRVATGLAMSLDTSRKFVLAESLPCVMREYGHEEPLGCSFASTFLHDIPRVLSIESIQNLAVISEPGFGYAPIIARQVQGTPQDRNIALFGFFQSFLFFDHRREEIQKQFTLPTKYETEAQDRLEWLIKGIADDIEPVAVHVRRTDYARYPGKHDMLQKEYYVQAARIVQEEYHVVFLIFSDDPEWCQEQEWLKTLGELVIIVPNDAKDFVDLKVMSLCVHHIIANSSFSWWAAYLSTRKRRGTPHDRDTLEKAQMKESIDEEVLRGLVVASTAWFGSEGPKVTIDHMFPNDWILL